MPSEITVGQEELLKFWGRVVDLPAEDRKLAIKHFLNNYEGGSVRIAWHMQPAYRVDYTLIGVAEDKDGQLHYEFDRMRGREHVTLPALHRYREGEATMTISRPY